MILNNILPSFPPPKFLSIPFAGLYISDTAIRCIKFGKRRNGLYIEKYAERVIPPGVITSGQVNNKTEFAFLIQSLTKDLHLDYVKVSLPEEKAYLFTAKIPLVSNSEIKRNRKNKLVVTRKLDCERNAKRANYP